MEFTLYDEAKGFHDSQGINFLISFYFFQNVDINVFEDLH